MSYQGYQGGRPTGYGAPPPQQGAGYGTGYGQQRPQGGPGYGANPAPGYGGAYGANTGYGTSPRPGYGGGYGSAPARPAPPPGPPNANPQQQQLYFWFQAVDTDKSGALEADELQRALINGDWSPFSIDTVRLMITMFDRDMNGTIDFQEFTGLWRYIEDWKKCFRTFDRDGSGSIDRQELFSALTAFGFRVSQQVVDALIKKMDMLGGIKNKGRGDIGFDKFIYACVTVKTLTDSFRSLDGNNDGWIELNYDSFLMVSLGNKLN
ncbi:hypothetical protein BB559_000703 [Furculomyces boomerangus]|uniref:EF-hand domain-containing protein n=2 Tax=Harpellales TaxID=61421 RepID=A0A2T9YE60_9FUNG|nr:hypothetical protein BB559_004531 [Furculomyces boomerangus]PVU99461.1 hypothetical protein BB559_000703 [Furculomyces boomerangus]PWA02734.1 hypothetical protein BB558_001122 [Smittium angustum]